MDEFRNKFHAALQERLDFIQRNREWIVEMFVAQHGFTPDAAALVQKDEPDGRIRFWVEKRGEYDELRQLRQEVALLRARLYGNYVWDANSATWISK